MTSGCLVTEQIIPPEEPNGPPVIISDPAVGTQILLNGMNELRIGLTVRNENTTEPLKVRFQLDSKNLPDPDERPLDFPCPEVENVIAGTGPLFREEFPLRIPGMKFPRNACTKLTVAVSADFFSCKNLDPRLWNVTTFSLQDDDDDGHRALATYYILEDSGNPLVNADAALRVLTTCPEPTKATSEMTRSVTTP